MGLTILGKLLEASCDLSSQDKNILNQAKETIKIICKLLQNNYLISSDYERSKYELEEKGFYTINDSP